MFEEMACDDYEDESENTLARACGIVVEMGSKGVKPNNGTYRYIVYRIVHRIVYRIVSYALYVVPFIYYRTLSGRPRWFNSKPRDY